MDDPKLTIELVPESCHFSNLRSNLTKQDWDKLRKACYQRFSYQCSVCGGKGSKHPVEAHEVWGYDEQARIQKLLDIVALCPNCHKVKHMGLSILKGWDEYARKHLGEVNGWTPAQVEKYEAACFVEYRRRSLFHWTLDVSWLKGKGVRIPKVMDRIDWKSTPLPKGKQ